MRKWNGKAWAYFLLHNFFMALGMTGTVAILNHVPLGTALLKDLLVAYGISLCISAVIPAERIGRCTAERLHAKPVLPAILAGTLANNLIFTTLMSLLMTAVAVGFTPAYFPAWLGIYPWALLAGYVVASLSQWLLHPLIAPPDSKEVNV